MNDRQLPGDQQLIEERILRRIPLETLLLSLIIACLSFLVFSPQTGLFILAGGAVSSASFLWLKGAISHFLGQDRRKAIKSGLTLYLFRFILLIALFSIIIFLFTRMILAFVAGFSTIIIVFFVEAVRATALLKQWKG